MVNHLISKGAAVNPVLGPNATGMVSLICLAVSDADNDTLLALLKAGADPNTEEARCLSTPLMRAVCKMKGNNIPEATKMLSTLLTSGADPNHVDLLGQTPLTHAMCLKGFPARLSVTNKLLEHGADPDLPNGQGMTPLVLCIRCRWTDMPPAEQRKARAEVAAALVAAGADVNRPCGLPGMPPDASSWPLLHALSFDGALRYGDEGEDYNKLCELYYEEVRRLFPSLSPTYPEPSVTLPDVPEEGWNNPVVPVLLKAGAEVSEVLLARVLY